MAKRIEVSDLNVYYGAFRAVEGVTLTVEPFARVEAATLVPLPLEAFAPLAPFAPPLPLLMRWTAASSAVSVPDSAST